MVTITKIENSDGYLIQRVNSDKTVENISRNKFRYSDILELVEDVIIKSVVNEENKDFIEFDEYLLDELSNDICDYCNIFEEVFCDIDMDEDGEFVCAFAIEKVGEDSEVFSEEEIKQFIDIITKTALYVLLSNATILECVE